MMDIMCGSRTVSFAMVFFSFLPPNEPAAGPAGEVPYAEAFDATSSLPPGWTSTRIRHPLEDDATITSTSPRSAPHCVLLTNATLPQALLSAPIGARGWSLRHLSFHTRRSSSFRAVVVVECSAGGGAPFRVMDSLQSSGSTAYVPALLSIPGPPGADGTMVFRWRVVPDSAGATGTFRLDDISVTGVPAIDLELAGVTLDPPAPIVGQPAGICVTVRNTGSEAVDMFDLFLDIMSDTSDSRRDRLGQTRGGRLAPGDSSVIRFDWDPVRTGVHRISSQVKCDGDGIAVNNSGELLVRVGSPRGSVVINEIMYAPDAEEPEWVELENSSQVPVSLAGWSITDAAATGKRAFPPWAPVLPPGGYVVLTKDSVALVDVRGPLPGVVLTVAGFPSLNNTGDAVTIFDAGERVMDSVWYSPDWNTLTGTSLERKDPLTSLTLRANWCSSTDSTGATPGRPNACRRLEDDLSAGSITLLRDGEIRSVVIRCSVRNPGRTTPDSAWVQITESPVSGEGAATVLARVVIASSPVPGDSMAVDWRWVDPPPGAHRIDVDVVWNRDQRPADNRCKGDFWIPYSVAPVRVTEIMASPLPGDAEYVELLNCTGAIVEIGGWTLNGLLLGSGQGSCPVAPGGYVVVGSDSALCRRFPWLVCGPADLQVFVLEQMLGLNNEGDSIVVRDPGGDVSDSLWYDSRWHNPAIADPTGRSLEKIVRLGASGDGKNWSTCVTNVGGTPGRPNSVSAGEAARTALLSCSPNPFSPDADGREDCVVLKFALPAGVSLANVTVYDSRGRLVRHLATGQVSGSEGEVVWDGYDDQRRGLPLGPYIAVLEAMDYAGGTVMKAKCLVVVARNL